MADEKAKYTPGPWTLELRQEWPFGFVIRAANGNAVLEQNAVAYSTAQKTRTDCENGIGFKWKDKAGFARQEVIEAIAEQDARGHLWAAAPELLEALKDARGWVDFLRLNGCDGGDIIASLRKIDTAIAKSEGRNA